MPSRKGKVVVAMSGGVDSSVAAALLVREGYEVIGCFMRLGSPGEDASVDGACATPIGHRGCCSINDAADARLVAAELNIPFYVCNFKDHFGRIIDYFVDEYARGRTPNPCVRCNDWLKFGELYDYAERLGADAVATGHYARVRTHEGRARLMRGVDRAKDQSYVLFGIRAVRLARLRLPIGEMHKPAVRDLAERLGLPVFDKPDSQDICFVPEGDYAAVVERRRPDLARNGAVVDTAGATLGTHEGHHRFTVGQRRKVGVALGYPVYVVDIDPGRNRVTVGTGDDLLATGCELDDCNWLTPSGGVPMDAPVRVQYRAHADSEPARLHVLDDGEAGDRIRARFVTPRPSIAAGQALVVYDEEQDETVLGGGWIRRVLRGA